MKRQQDLAIKKKKKKREQVLTIRCANCYRTIYLKGKLYLIRPELGQFDFFSSKMGGTGWYGGGLRNQLTFLLQSLPGRQLKSGSHVNLFILEQMSAVYPTTCFSEWKLRAIDRAKLRRQTITWGKKNAKHLRRGYKPALSRPDDQPDNCTRCSGFRCLSRFSLVSCCP